MDMTNVLIVNDKRICRDCVKGYLSQAPERYSVAAALSSAAEGVRFCMQHPIDLVIMDACVGSNGDALTVAAALKQQLPGIRVVIITELCDPDLIDRVRKGGADSFWYQEGEGELLEVLDRTVAGESVFPSAPPKVCIGNMASTEITPAELRVLRLMVMGHTDSRIAKELAISVPTVRYHVTQLFEKTGYSSRVSLIADLIHQKFLAPGF